MPLDLLQEVGIKFGSEEALDILSDAGCEVDREELSAKIPPQLVEKALETERKGRGEAQEQVTALRIENARLDERAKGAEGRAGELKEQVEGLQVKFAEVAKQQERKGRTAKAPKPQDP